MSIQTYSGLPAYSVQTVEGTREVYSDFAAGLAHLRHDPEYERLWIPKLEDFLKYDMKNTCHPMQYELNKHMAQEDADKDEEAYLAAATHLSTAERKMREQRLVVRKLERQVVFDKSVKEKLVQEKNLLQEYTNATVEAADIERASGVQEEYGRESDVSERDDHCDTAEEGA